MAAQDRFYCIDPDEICGISSGFTLFEKVKKVFRQQNTILLNDNLIISMDYPNSIVSNQKIEIH